MPTRKQFIYNLLIALVSSFSTAIIGVLCYFVLDITLVIPYIFWSFSVLMLINLGLFYWHRNLDISFFVTAFLIFLGCFSIALFSGGILSPMLYIMPSIVIAGYIMRRKYGRWSTIVIGLSIVLMYFLGNCVGCIQDYVPEYSKDEFSLIAILVALIMLGGILGDFMASSSYQVYKAKKQIESQNKEKEILLKEIHHRVKNNLQIVTSLLRLQTYQLPEGETKNVLDESRNRIASMALTHEMLYKGDDLANIGYDKYIKSLAERLEESLNFERLKVIYDIQVPELKLKLDTAIPLGLLINEILTNSFKYGLNPDRETTIYIHLSKPLKDNYILKIGDNGKGFSDKITHENTESLGLQLIHTLTEQLDGTIERTNEKGTQYVIHFIETASNRI